MLSTVSLNFFLNPSNIISFCVCALDMQRNFGPAEGLLWQGIASKNLLGLYDTPRMQTHHGLKYGLAGIRTHP